MQKNRSALSAHPDLHCLAKRAPTICSQRQRGCEIDAIEMESFTGDLSILFN
jgi:hypothetical protein